MVTPEEFGMALARMDTILAQRFAAPGASMDDRLLAKATADAIQSIANDKELLAAALEVLNGDS